MNDIKKNLLKKSFEILRITFIAVFWIFSAIWVTGQNTVSPYSIFGLGELQNRGFSKIQSMGGAGIAFRSGNSLNNVNPASYSGLDSLRIITEFGIQGKLYDLDSKNQTQSGFTGNLNYIAMGFRYNEFMGGSFGIVPFSSVGYSIQFENDVEGTNEIYTTKYVGSGGITQFYFSNAIRLWKHLSLGVTVSYLFGPLVQDEEFLATDNVPAFKISRRDFLRSFYFDYGMQYMFRVKKTDFVLGAVFSNKQNLNSNHIVELYESTTGSLLQGVTYNTNYLVIPTVWGAGIGISKKNSYQLLFDYHHQQWSDVIYPIQFNTFENVNRFSFGTSFRPWKIRAANKFYQNWTYRAGLNYQTSYLSFSGTPIDDKSVSFGIGMPVSRNISEIDFGVKVGTNGTTTNHLIRENYIMFQLGLSLNEFAFIRRTFD